MKLPHHLIESQFFMFGSVTELVTALGPEVQIGEIAEIDRVSQLGLPPAISRDVLSVMLGVNPGFLWSFEERPRRYYRHFEIQKGKGVRHIFAPRVALKIIQKWFSVQLSKRYGPPDHVYGFIPGRSHLQAASAHCGANWVFSVDVRDFFPSTTTTLVEDALTSLGYNADSAKFLVKFFCLFNGLAQGSPASPVLSNIAFRGVDEILLEIAARYGVRLSRFADDIVFSGTNEFPDGLPVEVGQVFGNLPWKLAPEKTETAMAPQRLKVHGLLVHGEHIRLTKGYRNRIRAYEHLMAAGKIRDDDFKRVNGHIRFARQVSAFSTPGEEAN